MTSKNIIFLDIDEVLCTSRSRAAYNSITALDPICCKFLLQLCEYENCKIVIHSSWRFFKEGIGTFISELNTACPELVNYIIQDENKRNTDVNIHGRAESINNWLDKYINEEEVDNIVIIDDLPVYFDGHLKYLESNFVKITEPSLGFGLADYYKAHRILRGDKKIDN